VCLCVCVFVFVFVCVCLCVCVCVWCVCARARVRLCFVCVVTWIALFNDQGSKRKEESPQHVVKLA
jgi:hypothetical protein